MQLRVRCPCGKDFSADVASAGKKAKCPACSRVLIIPTTTPQSNDQVGPETIAPKIETVESRAAKIPLMRSPPLIQTPNASAMPASFGSAAGGPSRTNRRSAKHDLNLFDAESAGLTGLIDWRFRGFIAPSVVSILYLVYLIIVALAISAMAVGNFWLLIKSPDRGEPDFYVKLIAADVSSLLAIFFTTLGLRLVLELVLVAFRCEEHLRELAEAAEQPRS